MGIVFRLRSARVRVRRGCASGNATGPKPNLSLIFKRVIPLAALLGRYYAAGENLMPLNRFSPGKRREIRFANWELHLAAQALTLRAQGRRRRRNLGKEV